MEITCIQMDVLISFYIDGDLSQALKDKVKEHLDICPTCRAKYNILSSLFEDMQKACVKNEEKSSTNTYPTREYKTFKNKLSAYVDNELSPEESVKMKKITINNKSARKELEDAYNIRKLMNNSFRKTKSEAKSDYSKKVLRQLNLDDNKQLNFNPIIIVSSGFIMSVLLISAIVIYVLTL